jgi:hypothetical protein
MSLLGETLPAVTVLYRLQTKLPPSWVWKDLQAGLARPIVGSQNSVISVVGDVTHIVHGRPRLER